MKKLLLSYLLVMVGCYTASAQDCGNDFLGTKTLYADGHYKHTPAPAGYRPVFINHVGRHGARHLTKDVKTTLAYTLLLQADSLHELTQQGKKLKQMVLALQKVEKGNTKSISAEGKDELRGLGERMYLNYPSVFEGKPTLNLAITKEVRTKQSADAFLQGLNSRLKDSAVVNTYNDDIDLRFYDESPAYKRFEDGVDSGAMTLSLQKAAHLPDIDNAVTARLFSSSFLNKMGNDECMKIVADVFGFSTIVYSLNAEIKQGGFAELDFKQFFTCDELAKFAMLDSADENLKKGPGVDNNGIQVRVAVPLLVNFINTSDAFVKGRRYNAQLRFAHAETIAPFAALLQIAGADKVSRDGLQVNTNWIAARVIPLSANIQWVFYKKIGAAGYLVKVLLNEREAHITGLHKAAPPYYKWADLRAFYIAKLSKLHVGLGDDMAAYLAGLK